MSGHVGSRILRIGAWTAFAGGSLVALASAFNAFVLDHEFNSLNADLEANPPAWAASVAAFSGAFACFLRAVATAESRRRFTALGVLLAYLSMDDIVRVHESVTRKVNSSFLGVDLELLRAAWPALFLPILAATFLLLLWVSSWEGGRIGTLLRVALALLVGAVLAEMSTALFYDEGEHFTTGYALEVAAEEGAELAAWILVATALAASMAQALAAGQGVVVEREQALRPGDEVEALTE